MPTIDIPQMKHALSAIKQPSQTRKADQASHFRRMEQRFREGRRDETDRVGSAGVGG
jgi:hypothetical protein